VAVGHRILDWGLSPPGGLWPPAPSNSWRLLPRLLFQAGLDSGREGQDAEHADKGDGGGIKSLGDEGGDAILLRGLDAEVGHVFTPFQNSAWVTCTASYHVTQGTLQYILSVRRNSLLHCDIGAQELQNNEC